MDKRMQNSTREHGARCTGFSRNPPAEAGTASVAHSVLLLILIGSLAGAAEPPRSTDDQLRDSLDSKTGDDYDRELLGDAAKPDDKGRADEQTRKRLEKELGAAAQKEEKPKDPLLQIAEEMREVPQRLDRRDSGAVTQHLQRQIVDDLAKLIEQAKQSGCCSGSNCNSPKPVGSGAKKQGNNSGQPSAASHAPAKESDPKNRKPDRKAIEAAKGRPWTIKSFQAALQSHDREQINELPSEFFLPDYKLEIEDYFRRLSEDQPAGDGK